MDGFDTAAIRERVLAAWAAAPVRFREDANAEEDQALGGYRDRLVVELAQNAADAAARAGVRGRLLLALRDEPDGSVLVAANVGAPLDAVGVEALATLRASAKRPGADSDGDDGLVGRFGVGFAAMLAVSDEPAVVSRPGGVRFSAADTHALVVEAAGGCPGLAEELARRDGHVPVLRLPFPAEGSPPDGYDTVVLLPLRDRAARELAARLLDEVDDALLLALPGLDEVLVDLPGRPVRTLADVGARWHVLRRHGRLDPALLADRPTEERSRTAWTLTWALPIGPAAGTVPPVVHAPTPSAEPLGWPALLVAPFPLDVSRRHVAPGPATDALVHEAARGYADLLAEQAALGRPAWPLVPVGLPAGAVDGALREALTRLLPGAAILHSAEDPQVLLRPRDAVALDPPTGGEAALVAALAPHLAGLVHAPRPALAALGVLGVRRVPLADIVEQLPLAGDGEAWRPLYDALLPLAADPLVREALASLPVPLADGRVARGARSLVLPTAAPAVAEALSVLGVRAVAAEAVHPLLERLGAAEVSARSALDLPEVRTAVRHSLDPPWDGQGFDPLEGDEPDRVEAVLTIVAAAVEQAALAPGDLPWLAALGLPDEDGEPAPAGELALPGSLAAEVLDADAVGLVEADLVQRWGAATLAAVGVLDVLCLLRAGAVPLQADGSWPDAPADEGSDPGSAAALDGWPDWLDEVAEQVGLPDGEGTVTDVVAVRDLDAVRDDAWPQVLAALAASPSLRAAVTTPVRVLDRAGRLAGEAPSYTAWWLRDRFAPSGAWADPDAEPAVAALLPAGAPALAAADPVLRAAAGAVSTVAGLGPQAVDAVVTRLADPQLSVEAGTAVRLWASLAALALAATRAGTEPAPAPALVRVLDGTGTRVVDADAAMVVDSPMLLQRTDLGGAVLVAGLDEAAALAELLDLPLGSELADGVVAESRAVAGRAAQVPAVVRALLPHVPSTWCEHEVLAVDDVEVDWWVHGHGADAQVHAATVAGLARGLAWACGVWERRAAVEEVLTDGERLADVLADEVYAGGPLRNRA